MANFIGNVMSALIGICIYRFLMTKEFKRDQNRLLEEARKLCNELLKIKDKGTIVIRSLSLSERKGPNQIVITTLPEERTKNENRIQDNKG